MSRKVGSLFAGVGGLELGLEAAGWETGFQVEWDKHAASVLARHWPQVPRWGDVRDVDGGDVPPVDLVSFGSPCTDLSLAGRRKGFANEEGSGLFFEATRIISEMRAATDGMFPRWGVWENVGGAFSSNDGRDFAAVLDELARVGATTIEWGTMDARYFGVPQRRFRVFVIAYFGDDWAELPERILPLAGDSKVTTSATGQQLGLFGAAAASPSEALNPHIADGKKLGWSTQGRWQSDGLAWQCHGQTMPAAGALPSPSLADLLEPLDAVEDRYFLSKKAALGVLKRAVRRGRALPGVLFDALVAMGGDEALSLDGLDSIGRLNDEETVSAITASQQFGVDVRSAQAGHLVAEQLPPGEVSSLTASMSKGVSDRSEQHLVPIQMPPKVAGTLGGGNGLRGRCDDLDRSGAFVPVAIAENQRGEIRMTEFMPAVSVAGGRPGQGMSTVMQPGEVAFPLATRGRDDGAEVEMGEANVANTLRAGDGGSSRSQQIITPTMKVRRLMPLETERLMGWPDRHTAFDADGEPIVDTHRFRMCGNGVASPVAAWLGEQIAAADPTLAEPAAGRSAA